MSRIDYPIHDYIRWIQSGTLYRLHHPRIFSRIRDNELNQITIDQTRVEGEVKEDRMTAEEAISKINSENCTYQIVDVGSFEQIS